MDFSLSLTALRRARNMDKIRAQRAIEGVLAQFDFEPVQYSSDSMREPSAVPGIDRLKDMAREVLQSAVYGKYCTEGHASVRCGGFEARIDRWPNSDTFTMALSFVPFRTEERF
jgi:hypothetical protein